MSRLQELQQDFIRALLDDDGELQPSTVRGEYEQGDIEGYRRDILEPLLRLLGVRFPNTRRVLHRDLFTYVSSQFIRRRPPVEGSLANYGERFPAFVRESALCWSLPYVADLARLEWAHYSSLQALATEPIDAHRLEALPEDLLGSLRIVLDPSLSLMHSPWCVDEIWRCEARSSNEMPMVGQMPRGICLEVRRIRGVAVCNRLPVADFRFRAFLRNNSTIRRAAAAALKVDVRFNVSESVTRLVRQSAIVAIVGRS